jgi:hypothetical protein
MFKIPEQHLYKVYVRAATLDPSPKEARMDLSKFKTSDWLMIGGAFGMLIFGLFLNWASYSGYSGNHAFDYFFTGGIAFLLIIAVGALAALLALGVVQRDAFAWNLAFLGAAALATLLMLFRLLLGGGSVGAGIVSIDLDRGAGMYLAFIAAAVVLVGAFLSFKESGGDINDLKDINKIKSQFSGGSAGGGTPPPPPPPPPPGATPPPPPPPPAG